MAILAYSGFESGTVYEGGTGDDHWGWEVLAEPYRSEAIRVVTDPVRAGNYALRVFWDWPEWPNFTTQPDKFKIRTELKRPNNIADFSVGNEYWIGYSVLIPDTPSARACVNSTYTNQSITQIHQRGNDRTSQLMARVGQWEISCPTGPKQFLGPVVFGKWTDFVIYYKCEKDNTGIFKVWVDAASASETPKYNQVNRSTMWSPVGEDTGYFKVGIYRQWDDTPGMEEIVQYYDEFRIGDGNESFDSIKPQGGTVEPPVDPPVIIEVTDLFRDQETGRVISLSGDFSATGKKVWISQGGPMVEQVVTAEDATSVTITVDYQGILTNGPAVLYVGNPQ